METTEQLKNEREGVPCSSSLVLSNLDMEQKLKDYRSALVESTKDNIRLEEELKSSQKWAKKLEIILSRCPNCKSKIKFFNIE